jgi:hypothetical protein
MKGALRGAFLLLGTILIPFGSIQADPPPVQDPSSQADIQAALSGGVPMGRWKEGLLFEGISPQPWLKSAANWFPNTEEVQPNGQR